MNIDQHVLDKLLELGSDLSKLHQMDFFLDFTTKDQAVLAANVIAREGFEVDTHADEKGEQWTCIATKEMVPEEEELVELRMWFESLAEDLDGTYDGWGALVTE